MKEKEKIRLFYEALIKIAKKHECIDTHKTPTMDNMIDFYVMRTTPMGLVNSFVALINSNNNNIEEHLRIIKNDLFRAGILFAKENPEFIESFHDIEEFIKLKQKSELNSYSSETGEDGN